MDSSGSNILLPDDVLEEVLSKLPVRDLLRLKCVCKSWHSLVNNYKFIMKHCQSQYARCITHGNAPLFAYCPVEPCPIVHERSDFYLLSKQQTGKEMVSNLTRDLHRDIATNLNPIHPNQKFNVVCCNGVVNGIVLLECYRPRQLSDRHSPTQLLLLWNPATREVKEIPNWQVLGGKRLHRPIVLGFDSVSHDFKIASFGKWSKMYSLRSNSWKRLQTSPPAISVDLSATNGYLDGVHYWASNIGNRCFSLLSFNFNSEVFKVFHPPQAALAVIAKGRFEFKVGLYMERDLAVIVCSDGEKDLADQVDCINIYIWVLTKCDDGAPDHHDDHGLPLSWKRLFNVRLVPTFNELSFKTIWMDGDLVLSTSMGCYEERQKFFVYNVATSTLTPLEIGFGACFTYVESLFPLTY